MCWTCRWRHQGARSAPLRALRLTDMDREPHGGFAGVGPSDAVAAAGREPHIVAGRQLAYAALALDLERGAAFEQQHPLALRLIEPHAGPRSLAHRHDALDADAPLGE